MADTHSRITDYSNGYVKEAPKQGTTGVPATKVGKCNKTGCSAEIAVSSIMALYNKGLH
jgi:hypothetical protein